jgi:hypothetical protein
MTTSTFPFHVNKARTRFIGSGPDDPLLSITFDTDDGGREGFLVEVKRDMRGNLLSPRYMARNAYGDKGRADDAGTAVIRLLKEWARVNARHGSPHELSVNAALDALLHDLAVIHAARDGMSVR